MENRRKFYPGTKTKITDPFFVVWHDECEYKAYSIHFETRCPKCGGEAKCCRADELEEQKT